MKQGLLRQGSHWHRAWTGRARCSAPLQQQQGVAHGTPDCAPRDSPCCCGGQCGGPCVLPGEGCFGWCLFSGGRTVAVWPSPATGGRGVGTSLVTVGQDGSPGARGICAGGWSRAAESPLRPGVRRVGGRQWRAGAAPVGRRPCWDLLAVLPPTVAAVCWNLRETPTWDTNGQPQ